jgi:hypothetical protein
MTKVVQAAAPRPFKLEHRQQQLRERRKAHDFATLPSTIHHTSVE